MSVVDEIQAYYAENGISAIDFKCKHCRVCKGDSLGFTPAREPYIGVGYENNDGTFPKLLFLSLDSGDSEEEPESRTIAAMRDWEKSSCWDVIQNRKNRHWYRTHEMAHSLLQPFMPELLLEEVHNFFAHTNSAKCCQNKDKREMADARLFDNCREYIPGEVEIFAPDVLITQGDWALKAVESFEHKVKDNQKECGHARIRLKSGRIVLWLHTYHPRRFGDFNRQRRDCWVNESNPPLWVGLVEQFFRTERSWLAQPTDVDPPKIALHDPA